MTYYEPKAIRRAYPEAVTIDTEYGVFDANGNLIEVDYSLVDQYVNETNEELAFEVLRAQRDFYLTETDWWATSDRTMTAEQTAYRQALRDLPATTTDPENPVWPEKP